MRRFTTQPFQIGSRTSVFLPAPFLACVIPDARIWLKLYLLSNFTDFCQTLYGGRAMRKLTPLV